MTRALLWLLQRLHLYAFAKDFGRSLMSLHPSALRQRQRMRAFYAQFIQPGDLCFDVGANLGDRTAIFLELGARVVAVEPQRRCRQQLQRRFRRETRFVLVPKALGDRPGEAVMNVAEADTISSLSPEWIHSVRASGRFAGYTWNKTETVAVTTLDALIAEFGPPVFCKIDVEGYEFQVLQGLNRGLAMISFEFTPEYLEPAISSIRRLAQLGPVAFNYSEGESMQWQQPEWLGAEAMISRLRALPDPTVFGDVYARF
jgi:FkbM family methyltransferase